MDPPSAIRQEPVGAVAPRRGRLRRWAPRILVWTLVASFGLWVAIHRVSWLGPALADGLRAVLGPAAVAWMEDVAYGIQDRVNLWRYDGEAPKTFWELPKAPSVPRPELPGRPIFAPAAFEAPFADVSSPADGTWLPVADPLAPSAPPVVFKTLVHPDKRRSFAALAVVAADLRAFDLHLVAGTSEPVSQRLTLAQRPGRVPAEHVDRLFAVFNGGFKATHGQYGMMVGDVDLLPPRDIACTFALYRDGSYHIATWSVMKADREQLTYYRQTPPCLVEDGKVNEALSEHAKGWGATVSGDTVIRRSAMGLSEDRKTLYYGLGEAMTAQALAVGMKAAGAHWVAELDVNYSYPRMLFYERPDPERLPIAATAIIPAIDFTRYDYVANASPRDFFYLTRSPEKAAAPVAPKGKLASQ